MRIPSVLPHAAIAVVTALALSALPGPLRAQGSTTLRGTVLSEMGTPLSGAHLRFSAPLSKVKAAESDDSGTFIFAGLPGGEVWLHARRIGFRPDSRTAAVCGRSGSRCVRPAHV
jgi:hypothetical protein